MTESLSLSIENGVLTASLHGEIDHHSAVGVRTRIDDALYLNRPQLLVIDIGAVDFMDSSGLGLIMGRLAKTAEMGSTLHVAGCSARTEKMLKMAGLAHLIQEKGRNKV